MQARRIFSLFGLTSALVLSGLNMPAAHAASPIAVAANFDIEKFAGGWFEVARTSSLGSAMCNDAITAFAAMEEFPNTLQATFTCKSRFSVQSVSGVLSPADDRYPSTLLFTWSRPPKTNTEFYVLAVAPDYSWALVGDSSRSNAYVYSRTASIDPAVLRTLIIRLDTDFDYVRPERTMNCSKHGGAAVPGCAEVLDG
jgi:apolipoprotein D and lipocalin family protein